MTLAFSLKWILEEEERSGSGVGGEESEGERWASIDERGTFTDVL